MLGLFSLNFVHCNISNNVMLGYVHPQNRVVVVMWSNAEAMLEVDLVSSNNHLKKKNNKNNQTCI